MKRTIQWTLSALQTHPWALIVADEDATLGTSHVSVSVYRAYLTKSQPLLLAELRVKTVKYFKSIEKVQEEVDAMQLLNAKADR
jgi:glucosamine-6-phosphate deaminase